MSDNNTLAVKRLEAEEVVIKSPNSKNTITISAAHDNAGGIWIERDKKVIAIYCTPDQTALGIYADVGRGINIGLSVNDKEGFLQISNNETGEIKILDISDFK